jgi:hypothetical protein
MLHSQAGDFIEVICKRINGRNICCKPQKWRNMGRNICCTPVFSKPDFLNEIKGNQGCNISSLSTVCAKLSSTFSNALIALRISRKARINPTARGE